VVQLNPYFRYMTLLVSCIVLACEPSHASKGPLEDSDAIPSIPLVFPIPVFSGTPLIHNILQAPSVPDIPHIVPAGGGKRVHQSGLLSLNPILEDIKKDPSPVKIVIFGNANVMMTKTPKGIVLNDQLSPFMQQAGLLGAHFCLITQKSINADVREVFQKNNIQLSNLTRLFDKSYDEADDLTEPARQLKKITERVSGLQINVDSATVSNFYKMMYGRNFGYDYPDLQQGLISCDGFDYGTVPNGTPPTKNEVFWRLTSYGINFTKAALFLISGEFSASQHMSLGLSFFRYAEAIDRKRDPRNIYTYYYPLALHNHFQYKKFIPGSVEDNAFTKVSIFRTLGVVRLRKQEFQELKIYLPAGEYAYLND
jgi:hypothetical protein